MATIKGTSATKICKWFKKHWLVPVLTILAFIISNQAVQPILSPRLSTFEVSEPLYIQGNLPDIDPNYYQIFKVTYTIEPSLLDDVLKWVGQPPQKIRLNLPGAETDSNIDVGLINGMKESNPYAYFEMPDESRSWWVVPTEKLNHTISLNLKTGGFSVRSFTTTLYFAQKIQLNEGNLWSSSSVTRPEIRPTVESISIEEPVCGYLQVLPNITRTYSFSRITITNKNSIPIKEFWFKFQPGTDVCESDYRLGTGHHQENGLALYAYILIDMEPHQTRNFIAYSQTNYMCPPTYKSFNVTGFWCSDLDKKLN